MKKVLILGLGYAQVDAIYYLKSRGYYVIGCSYREEGPGLRLVDQFSLTNITDIDAVEAIAKKEKVNFLYSVGSDIAMPIITKVSSKLGLPSFLTVEQTNQLVNKGDLRVSLQQFSISPIIFNQLQEPADIQGWNTFPAILKPVDSQGSRGVFFIENIDDIYYHIEESLHFSRSKSAIIEEYLDGPEITALVMVKRGKIIFCLINDRLTVEAYHTGIPKGHRTPSQFSSSDDIEKTNILISQVIKSLDIKNGPLYFQLKLTYNGPKILEIGPRLDGGHIWKLIKLYCGVDILDITFRLLMNEELPSIEPQPKFRYAQLDFSLQPPGEEFDSGRVSLPTEILTYQPYYNKGEIVLPINGILEKTGYYIWGKTN